jgi:hypothetical protein
LKHYPLYLKMSFPVITPVLLLRLEVPVNAGSRGDRGQPEGHIYCGPSGHWLRALGQTNPFEGGIDMSGIEICVHQFFQFLA